jgi:hypothetical protein
MAHVELTAGLPGIRGLFAFRPETPKPLCELAEALLHTPGTLSMAERERAPFLFVQRSMSYFSPWAVIAAIT